jgi:hypothetical protein
MNAETGYQDARLSIGDEILRRANQTARTEAELSQLTDLAVRPAHIDGGDPEQAERLMRRREELMNLVSEVGPVKPLTEQPHQPLVEVLDRLFPWQRCRRLQLEAMG